MGFALQRSKNDSTVFCAAVWALLRKGEADNQRSVRPLKEGVTEIARRSAQLCVAGEFAQELIAIT